MDGLQRAAVEPVDALPPFVSHVHQSHLSQHPQVLGHQGLGYPSRHEIVHGPFPAGEDVQDLPPPGLRDRVERVCCRRRPGHARMIYTHIGICQAGDHATRPGLRSAADGRWFRDPGREPFTRRMAAHTPAMDRGAATAIDERDAFVGSSIEPGEQVVLQIRNHPLVTDRRIIDAKPLHRPPGRDGWVLDAVLFSEPAARRQGAHRRSPVDRARAPSAHDDRPGARTPIPLVHVGERGRTGDSHEDDLRIRQGDEPRVRRDHHGARSPEGSSGFRVRDRPAGTRAERLREGQSPLREHRRAWIGDWIRFRTWHVADVVYRGRLAWPIRVVSWLLVGVPAWFVSPWLVVPAIICTELAWIVFMQVMWLRSQARRR